MSVVTPWHLATGASNASPWNHGTITPVNTEGAPVGPLVDPEAIVLPRHEEPRLASWSSRVIASLLDGALGTGATFLLLGSLSGVPFLGASFLPGDQQEVSTLSWTDSGWVVGVTLLIAAMQAYLGVTPGKMVIGIAVVGERDARPVGLVTTGLRGFAHIIDSFLLIGYLRPLWNARRRTFADSIMGTLVLDTRRPRQHRWFAARGESAADPGPPGSWEAPAAPRWRPAATAFCAVACGVGVLLSIDTSGRSPSGPIVLSCALVAPDTGPAGLTGATLNLTSVDSTSTRLGVTRHTPRSEGPITATWQWSAPEPAPQQATLRSSFARADGSGARHYDYPATNPTAQEETVSLPPEALRGLGETWTWTATILVNGVESPGCTESLPDFFSGGS